jgi:orotidine-5'-phosphate decarboxylase
MKAPQDRLIFPLDVPTQAEALDLIQVLTEEVGLFKVGLELYLAEGPGVLRKIADQVGPARIFLDLKLYDIPATVQGAMHAILPGLALMTIPSDLGPTALKKIVAAAGSAHRILAVTVLTSAAPADLKVLGYAPPYYQDPTRLVILRAKLARESGCQGVVCSGREVRAVKEACGQDFLTVCPGIRPAWATVAGDDQKRIVTPSEAIKDGADYIVVGRPIRQDPNPAVAAHRVVAEIAAGLEARPASASGGGGG